MEIQCLFRYLVYFSSKYLKSKLNTAIEKGSEASQVGHTKGKTPRKNDLLNMEGGGKYRLLMELGKAIKT